MLRLYKSGEVQGWVEAWTRVCRESIQNMKQEEWIVQRLRLVIFTDKTEEKNRTKYEKAHEKEEPRGKTV